MCCKDSGHYSWLLVLFINGSIFNDCCGDQEDTSALDRCFTIANSSIFDLIFGSTVEFKLMINIGVRCDCDCSYLFIPWIY